MRIEGKGRIAAFAAAAIAGLVLALAAAAGGADGDGGSKPPPVNPAAEHPRVGPDGKLERNPDGSLKMHRSDGPPPIPPGGQP